MCGPLNTTLANGYTTNDSQMLMYQNITYGSCF